MLQKASRFNSSKKTKVWGGERRFLRQCLKQQDRVTGGSKLKTEGEKNTNKVIKPSQNESPGKMRPLLNTVEKRPAQPPFLLPPKYDHNVR